MPRYLWAEQYVPPASVAEYTVIPASAYDFSGYARNWFPEQFALQSVPHFVQQEVPAPYGPASGSPGPGGA
jgi:hypothetical protein